MAAYPGGAGGHGIYSNMQSMPGLPPDYDLSLHGHHQHQQAHPAAYDFQGDLELFTNTQFFDFDMGEVTETQSPISEETSTWAMRNAGSNNPSATMGSVDYLAGGDLQPMPNYFPNIDSASSSRNPSLYPQPTLPSSQHFNPSIVASPNSSTPGNQAGEKRKAETGTDSAAASSSSATPAANSLEEASRAAAEEDKRRRNTAASARFRVKKKQREQALEKSAKEMTDRVTYLEQRVSTLEMENKLLKDLITEKSGQEVNVSELTSRISATAKEATATTAVNVDSRFESSDKSKKEVKIEKAQEKGR